MYFQSVVVIFMLFAHFNCETSTADYEESLLELNETIDVSPKVVYEYELFNENDDTNFLKWLTLYKFDVDNSTVLEINQKLKIHSNAAFTWIYAKTPNRIVFQPSDFKKVYLFFTTQSKDNLRIINSESEILVNKFKNPFCFNCREKRILEK